MANVGVYPGSFNPPTIAHLAIAESAVHQAGLQRVDLAVSRLALGKPEPAGPTFEDRLRVLETMAASRPWLGVVVTDAQLIADIAAGYDAVLMGADKWAQVIDPAWYASTLARDEAVARLPRVLVAARPPFSASDVELLELPTSLLAVSSTAARQGHREFMSEEAASFDQETGAWSDPDRYARFVAERPGTLEA